MERLKLKLRKAVSALVIAAMVWSLSPAVYAAGTDSVTTLPSVQSSVSGSGSYTLTEASRFYIVSDTDPNGTETADYVQLLNAEFAAKGIPTSKVLPIVWGTAENAQDGDIIIAESGSGEGYTLEITSSSATVTASPEGIFYGLRTLLKGFSAAGTTLPACTIEDAPEVDNRILLLDCGRKYFSKDWICALIKDMSWVGYNQLMLGIGNDGLRFLLDDMTITAGGTTYESDSVKYAIDDVGNAAYSTGGYLTETEMDEIIAAAAKYNIEIVPMLNTPGHMDAILDAMEYLGIDSPNYSTSGTSVDFSNTVALAFTKELIEKYVSYFAAHGSTYFHLGGDEYANDMSTMGFQGIYGTSFYTDFQDYINELAQMVTNYSMTPRIWNDGMYYNGRNNNSSAGSGSFDRSLQVTYWSCGWSGYNVASASAIAGKGHDMINSNGDYYYVLGKNSAAASSIYSNFTNTGFMGSSGLNGVGSQYCVWCDYPGAQTETQVASGIYSPMRAFAEGMWDSDKADTFSEFTARCSEVGSAPGGFYSNGVIDTAALPTASDITADTSASRGAVTVSYVDDAGVTIRTSTSLTGEIGEAYTVAVPEISGYLTPEGVSGVFTQERQYVTLVYILNTDKAALAAELAAAVEQGNYTDSSYAVYSRALTAARAVYDTERATQSEIDGALRALQAAKAGLTEKGLEPESISIASTFGTYDTYEMENAIDGDLSSFWWTSSAQQSGETITLAFDDVYYFNAMRVYSYTNFAKTDYLRGASVSVSNDGKTWTDVGTISGRGTTTPIAFSPDEAVSAKYVRLTINQTVENWLTICEVEFDFTSAPVSVDYGSVTVNYIDDAGKILKASETLTGQAGTTYTITADAIEGYTTPAAVTGTYERNTTATVNLVYILNTDKTALKTELDNVIAQGGYTNDSYAAYTAAIAAGQAVYDNARAVQSEVDAAVAAIINAKAGLTLKPSADVVAPSDMTVTAFPAYYSTYSPVNAIDGNKSTFYWAASPQAANAVFTVDFEGYYTLNYIGVITNHARDYIRGATVQYSLNGVDWITLGTIVGTANNSDALMVALDEYIDARYVRICLNTASSNWWVLNEIQFGWGPASTYVPAEEVIAYTKDTDGIDAGSEYVIKAYGADYALGVVDGVLAPVAVGVTDDSITAVEDSCVWVAAASSRGYTLRNKATGEYLSFSSSGGWWGRPSSMTLQLSASACTWYTKLFNNYTRLYVSSGWSNNYLYYGSNAFSISSSIGGVCNMSLYSR